jgi:putative Mg2+ transporter-C (MgtC) family protein
MATRSGGRSMTGNAELDLFAKVVLAGLLGFAVGFERELMGSPAGDRTFSLVAIGSALVTALSFDIFGPPSGNDPGRVIANILTGVGFLGGGMILKEGGTVRGLTTAAGIWAVAAVGMAIGSERYLLGVLTTGLIMLTLAVERFYSVKTRRSNGATVEDAIPSAGHGS